MLGFAPGGSPRHDDCADPEMMSAAAGPREAARPVRVYRYYDLVMAAFVTVLLCANVIGAAKRAQLFGFTFGAGVLFFPVSCCLGDILTEVYGYARARKVVWALRRSASPRS